MPVPKLGVPWSVPSRVFNSLPAGNHPAGKGLWIMFIGSVMLYGLFQKKLLPKSVARVASKFLFVPTLPITLALRWGNLWTKIDNTLIVGTAPVGFLGHPKELYKQGVRGVINMCEEYSGPLGYYSDLGITQLRLPTVDHFEPSLESMQEAMKFIEHHKKNGDMVYVHCKAGHGRAGAIGLCWMMHENLHRTAEENNIALSSIRKVRTHEKMILIWTYVCPVTIKSKSRSAIAPLIIMSMRYNNTRNAPSNIYRTSPYP